MNKLNLGAGLFSSVSVAMAAEQFKVRQIPLEALDPNDDAHGFSLEGIEELADSMQDVGLQQNLVVEAVGNDSYVILTGRRRYYAAKLLKERGNDKFKTLPCVVMDLAAIDLPIDEETKRIYAIATTNAEQRKPTAADTAELIRKLNIVYDALESAGAKPKGRRRDYVANALGVSAATVGRYEYVEKHSEEAEKSKLQKGEKSLRQALSETKNKKCAHMSTSGGAATKKLKKAEIFVLPYNNFTAEEYILTDEEYTKATDIIKAIELQYKKLAKLLGEAGKNVLT